MNEQDFIMTTYFNHIGYSDIEPYECVRKVSEKTMEIRKMKCELINREELKYHVGGFMAHCSNQHEQKWNIVSNDKNRVFRIRLHKDGWWRDAGGNRYRMSDTPKKFYDFNF